VNGASAPALGIRTAAAKKQADSIGVPDESVVGGSLPARPLRGVDEELLIRLQIMRAGVMAEGEADDAGFRVFCDPDAGMRLLVFVAVVGLGEGWAFALEEGEKVKTQ
jgi:hypothetical protein